MLSGRRRENAKGLWRMVVGEGGEGDAGTMAVDLVGAEGVDRDSRGVEVIIELDRLVRRTKRNQLNERKQEGRNA
jgi:hypothetical protein